MTTDELMKLVDEYAEQAFVQGLRRAKKLEGLEEVRSALLKAVESLAALEELSLLLHSKIALDALNKIRSME